MAVVEMCTLNLRLLVVHSFDQEDETGPILHTLEFWIERGIQRLKKSVKDHVVRNPEIYMGQAYLLSIAVDNAQRDTRHLQNIYDKSPRSSAGMEDNHMLYMHFMDVGQATSLDSEFVGQLTQVGNLLSRTQNFALHDDFLHHRDSLKLTSFKRLCIGGEEIASVAYTRSSSRCSHHVRLRSMMNNEMGILCKFAKVLKYYLLHTTSNEDLVFRFCVVEAYPMLCEDRELQVQIVDLSNSSTMLLSTSEIMCKTIFFQTPKHKDDKQAIALNCWSMGRI